MLILNLGCGSRTSRYCVNIDWSPYLRLKRNRVAAGVAPALLRGERRERFQQLDESIVVHDLRRRLPIEDSTVDAVYHSHVLEHFDRSAAGSFLAEINRVLRPGGVHRVVVPDFEASCRRYIGHVDTCVTSCPDLAIEHDGYIADIIEQMVREESSGTSQQPFVRRQIENLVFGDARRRGETHRWMYDRINLPLLLRQAGFHRIEIVDYRTSDIPRWDDIRLDQDDGGDQEYKPGSLYIEARKRPPR